MTAKMEYTGKDVTEAIQNACDSLNVSQEMLTIEVLSTGTSGIFGILGRKKAKILVAKKDKDEAQEMELPKRQQAPSRAPTKKAKQPAAARPRKQAADKTTAPLGDDVLDQARTDISKMLELIGFPSTVSVSQEKNKILAHIDGEYVEQIISDEGQILDSLQYLIRKMLSKRFASKIMVTLDAGDYRNTRSSELEELALKLSAEVKETGKTKTIPALNPAERRIVHMTLQDDSTIRSRSVGEGLFKKILIYVPGKGRKKSSGRRKPRNRGRRPQNA